MQLRSGLVPPARPLADTLVLPAAPEPGGGRRRVRSAVRRVMVTPTFAAGLGVVIAAALAAPAATDLHYNAVPDHGRPCPAAGCHDIIGGDRHGLATAAPGVKLPTPAPQHLGGRHSGPAAAGLPPGLHVRYETVRGQMSGQWVGEIEVTTSSAHPLPSWSLTFSYRSDQILRVWRDGWLPHGRHSATVAATERAGAQSEWQPPGTPETAIMIVMSGSPGPPDSCTINGQPCRLG